jgi:cytochrome c biogenesis protein CcdA
MMRAHWRMLLWVLLALGAAAGGAHAADLAPVIIDYFFEPGCPECERVKLEVLPHLAAQYEGFYTLRLHDVGIRSNVVLLAAYQQALGMAENAPVSMIVDYRVPLQGVEEIRRDLLSNVEARVLARTAADWQPPTPIVASTATVDDTAALAARAQQFTLPMIILSGLIDGINPCAVSTLVFFMSMLMVAKIRGRALLTIGAAFCAASYVTYFALGFGLLRVLHSLRAFGAIQRGVELVMLAVLALFAFLSFRDAWRFARHGNPDDVSMQLSHRMKERIHAVMRRGVRYHNLLLGGILIGCLVTMLESICTGQVYVPTLVMLLKSQTGNLRAWLYLMLYNALFVLPLVLVFVLVYRGMNMARLLAWSRRNVVISKCALGCFFMVMAALIFVLK